MQLHGNYSLFNPLHTPYKSAIMFGAHFHNSSTGTIKLAQDLSKLINNRQGSDVQFKVGGGIAGQNIESTGETIIDTSAAVTIYAHSAILSCRSQHFATIFQNEIEWKERTGGVIYMPNILPVIFENILEYIYTGSVTVKTENLVGLIAASEELQIKELGVKCQDMVIHILEQAFSDIGENEKDENESNLGQAFSDERESEEDETENTSGFFFGASPWGEENETKSREEIFLEQETLAISAAIDEILIPALKLAHSLNLQNFFQKLSDLTHVYIEFILASPEIRTLFVKNVSTQIFTLIVLQGSIEIFRMNKLSSIPSSLKAGIILECQRLSEAGDILALSRLGLCWQYGFGIEKDYFRAAECFTKAADAGNIDAQYSLGLCYFKGQGVDKDCIKAVELYTKAADAGNIYAQDNLGQCYQVGTGVIKDYTKAIELFTIAAEAGNTFAQNNLGNCYKNGSGVIRNYTKAVELYTRAAEGGNTCAQNNLGSCYKSGSGVDKDIRKAVKLYTKAAESGNATAQKNLAICYENGDGVAQDYVRAIQLYTKAAEAGIVMAQQSLIKLKEHLHFV